jgi:hypothetical protein
MKRRFVLRRWAVVAVLCLLLAGILTVSLGWAAASSWLSPAAPHHACAEVEAATSASLEPSKSAETSKGDLFVLVPEAGSRPTRTILQGEAFK